MNDKNSRRWFRAYRLMDYSFQDYVFRLIVPFAGMGVLVLLISYILSDLLGPLRYLLYVLAVLFPAVGVFYPKIWAESRRKELEQNIHLFITELGVLATTGVGRVELFRIMSEKEEEYGPLAEEARNITILIDTWNTSLDEACRIVSKRTASPILSDFFERMAHSLEAGEDIQDFIMGEQEVVMSDYESMYEGSLDMVYNFRDMFIAMTLAVVFFIVFGILIPFISGISPLLLIGGALVIFLATEIGFLLATEFTLPYDPLWAETEVKTAREERLEKGEILALALFVGFAAFVALQLIFRVPFSTNPSIPFFVYFALPLSPLAIPGFMIWREEGKIKDRDKNFPSFIRSLGSSATARQTTTVNVLERLREKEFGELTDSIRDLYKRLRTRIDRVLAWDLFSAEAGSFLVRKFSDMYYEGAARGGEPKEVSEIISDNFKTIMRVREKRYAAAGNIRGVLYGITAGAVISLFIGFYLATQMMDVVGSIAIEPLGKIFFLEVYDIPEIRFMLLLVILINALLCSLYMRSVSSGHQVGSYVHMVILLWMGILMGCLVEMGMAFFITL